MRILSLILIFLSSPAFAVLGEKFDEAQNRSAVNTPFASYSKHEFALTKNMVRQFSDSTGKVFAVSWQGKAHPDLAALLGTQLPAFEKALATARAKYKGHAPITVDAAGLHVEMGGNSRALSGRVWINGQIPQGVNTDDLR